MERTLRAAATLRSPTTNRMGNSRPPMAVMRTRRSVEKKEVSDFSAVRAVKISATTPQLTPARAAMSHCTARVSTRRWEVSLRAVNHAAAMPHARAKYCGIVMPAEPLSPSALMIRRRGTRAAIAASWKGAATIQLHAEESGSTPVMSSTWSLSCSLRLAPESSEMAAPSRVSSRATTVPATVPR
ncbi:hypothetical protein ACJ65_10735 [Kocuria rhizophila]|nr:hypothetical protein ACJ65_10735 [Kocuria rhizophila]